MAAFIYIAQCADGPYYVGSTQKNVEGRIAEHNSGHYGGYTAGRRPVALVYQQEFARIDDAINAERQVKGWSRAKRKL